MRMRRRCTSRRAGSTGSRPTLSSSHSGSAMSLRTSGVISRRCREKRGRLRSHASEQNSVTGYARFENTIRRTCSFTTGVVLIPSRGSLDRQAAENQGRPFGELTPLQQAASEPPGSTFSITRAWCAAWTSSLAQARADFKIAPRRRSCLSLCWFRAPSGTEGYGSSAMTNETEVGTQTYYQEAAIAALIAFTSAPGFFPFVPTLMYGLVACRR
jgi:hypothetical protein